MCDRLHLLREAALRRADERQAERKLALKMIQIGYEELTKFGVSD
jgi:hypothetical protein